LNGGHLENLFQPGEIIAVIFIPLGLITATFGFSGLSTCLSVSKYIFSEEIPNEETRNILSYWITMIYLTAGLAFVLAIIITLQFIGGSKLEIGERLTSSVSCFVLAFILCETIIRPIKNAKK
jgi:hypothetical protein